MCEHRITPHLQFLNNVMCSVLLLMPTGCQVNRKKMSTARQTPKEVKSNSSNLLFLSFTCSKTNQDEQCCQTTRGHTLQATGKTSREPSERSCSLDPSLIQNSLNYVAFGMLEKSQVLQDFSQGDAACTETRGEQEFLSPLLAAESGKGGA